MTVIDTGGGDATEAAAKAVEAAAEATEAAAEAVEAVAEAAEETSEVTVTEHDLEVVERLVNIERDVQEHGNRDHLSEDWVRSIARDEAQAAVAGLLPAVAEVMEEVVEEVVEEAAETADEPEVTIVEPDIATSEDGDSGGRRSILHRLW